MTSFPVTIVGSSGWAQGDSYIFLAKSLSPELLVIALTLGVTLGKTFVLGLQLSEDSDKQNDRLIAQIPAINNILWIWVCQIRAQ